MHPLSTDFYLQTFIVASWSGLRPLVSAMLWTPDLHLDSSMLSCCCSVLWRSFEDLQDQPHSRAPTVQSHPKLVHKAQETLHDILPTCFRIWDSVLQVRLGNLSRCCLNINLLVCSSFCLPLVEVKEQLPLEPPCHGLSRLTFN